ncbi:hypothetical protein [Candidatus Enterococcus ferrettii]|uniref:Uncharacterized protein n=1 Tax=Candidatus Enterococcus ferrettii TaxID=2815324 RepID=A0ABV0EMW1_9ENTE|nr:hypothetical protein [Enterococcus sp. 665A]MBO1342837.1 hypothetical protein [Enterococcus sp. 665A]
MNKKRTIYALFANKRVKKVIGIFLILAVLGIGSVFGMNSFKEKKEEVSAHPTNAIKLDEGGANEFEVQTDGETIKEQALINQAPKFNTYLQNNDIVPILEKTIIEGSAIENSLVPRETLMTVIAVERTNFGHYFVLYSTAGVSLGGLVKVAVFTSEGKVLSENITGTAINTIDRVLAPFFHADNNEFLVQTQSKFFRYKVGNETANTANITRTELIVPNHPATNLKASIIKKVDVFGNYTDDSLIVGRIGSVGIVNGRIPIGTINVNGWKNTGFSGNSTYEYSIENLKNSDVKISETGLEIAPLSVFLNSTKKLYGTFYNKGSNGRIDSFQIFSTEEEVKDATTGKNIKKRKYAYITDKNEGLYDSIYVLKELCTEDKAYFMVLNSNNTEMIEVDLTSYTDKVVKTYPKDTNLKMIDNGDGSISYFGSTTDITGEFYSDHYTSSLTGTNYFVSGLMSDLADTTSPLEVRSVRAFVTDGIVYPTAVLDSGNNRLFIGGETDDTSNFVDTMKYYINETTPSKNEGIASGRTAFVGSLEIKDDYSPAIDKSQNISVDLADTAITQPGVTTYHGWNTLDRWLITGSKNGAATDTSSIKVHDHFDSQDILLGATAAAREEWLQKRINRNPKDITAAIEWDKLGFDKTNTGPQQVTYFVSDTQNQQSVTSRWVNAKSPQTVEEDDYALDAQNFHVPLTGITTAIPDADKFKELAKTMAWSLTKHESTDGDQGDGLDEDGSDSSKLSTKVTVDTVQLKTLKEATVAKPYPVDVTYKPESGIEIKNRVWVFVTTKNTVPNSETNPKVTPADTNGVVYYADDYSLPFRLRAGHSTTDVLDRGNVRVYDYYDSTHETAAELPVLADKTTNSTKLQVINLNAIKTVTQPGLIDSSPPDGPAMIRYEWDGAVDGNHQSGTTKPTLGGLDVTLTGDILLHVRQVIVGESNQLVVPEEGYLRMTTNDYDGLSGTTTENVDQLRQVRISSGKNTDNPAFEMIAVNADHMDDPLDELELKLIIPEYYEPVGNYLTLGNVDANGTSHAGKTEADSNKASLIFQRDDLYNDEEYFITIYLKPKLNQEGPQPYSWDYKKNDLGKIKTK